MEVVASWPFEFQSAHRHCVEMLGTAAEQVPDVQPSTVVGTVKAFSKEDVQKFIQMNGNPGVFRAVVGTTDALFLPVGYVFCEANMLRVNYGITIPAILRGDCLESLAFCNTYLAHIDKHQYELVQLVLGNASGSYKMMHPVPVLAIRWLHETRHFRVVKYTIWCIFVSRTLLC